MQIIDRSPTTEEGESPESYTWPYLLDKQFPWYLHIQDICLTLATIFKEAISRLGGQGKTKIKCDILNNRRKQLEKCWERVETP